MRHIPQLRASLLMALALLLVACGGGTGMPTDSLTSAKATLTGEVLSIDGDESAVDGVVLSLRETGQIAESDADGFFTFGAVPTGSLTLDLVTAASYSTKSGDSGSGSSGSGDDAANGGEDNDMGDQSMNMERVRAQERIHVRLRIQDGELGEMQCVREENTERETERHMVRTQDNADPDMEGEMEMTQTQERERFCVEVENADAGLDLEAVVMAADGSEESLGTRTVQQNGECEWRIDTSQGGRLPFGAASVEDLEGYRVQVREMATGTPVLHGEAPGLPPVGDHAQTRTEEQTRESADDSDGDHDRARDQDQDRTQDQDQDCEQDQDGSQNGDQNTGDDV